MERDPRSAAAAAGRPCPPPVVATVTMGYGHLRAAMALAEGLGTTVAEVDRPPWASHAERRTWTAVRIAYGALSRLHGSGPLGGLAKGVLRRLTALPAAEDGSRRPGSATRFLDLLLARGFLGSLAARIEATEAPLLATFYAPALAVDRDGRARVACLVTDCDAHRVWVAVEPERSRILYLAPTATVAARLRAYGVPVDRVAETGFPLPPELVLRAPTDLAARLARLDPTAATAAPPRLVFAVGGAGAQADRAPLLVAGVREAVATGALTLTLVAGTDRRLAEKFSRLLRAAGLGDQAEVLCERDFASYYRAFNELLTRTDILWSKPSELVFYAALGIPLLLDDPVGDHERRNRDWLEAAGAGLAAPEATDAGGWLRERLADGSLTAAARAGYRNLPRDGAERIRELVISLTPC